jgi:hypothetical protein
MENQFCFYKINTYNNINVFTEPVYYQLLFDALSFIKKKYRIDIFAYTLVPNQLNLITDEKLIDQQAIFTDTLKTITRNEIIKLLEDANRTEILEPLEIAKGKKKYRLWEVNQEIEVFNGIEKLAVRIDMLHNKPVLLELTETPATYQFSSAKYYLNNTPTEIKITDFRLLPKL